MTQVAHDTDATMENATDFRDLYRRKVRLPGVTGGKYVVFHDHHGHWVGMIVVASGKIDTEVAEEQWQSSEDAVVFLKNKSSWWSPPDAEPEEFPTIFSGAYHRKVLFSKPIEIQPGTLRRWKPHITLDLTMTPEEDDD